MKYKSLKAAALMLAASTFLVSAQTTEKSFSQHFKDETLRLDYVFAGNNHEQNIFLDKMSSSAHWYGRRNNLNRFPLKGNGQIVVTDTLARDTLYCYSFSSLFQEWVSTEEATRVSKSFQNCFYIPMPKEKVLVSISLYDTHQNLKSCLKHETDPQDILVRHHQSQETKPWHFIKKNGESTEKIDIVFVPEGYTKIEMDEFYKDCEASIGALLHHKPFSTFADRFNFIAVDVPSSESGVSIPHKNLWINTLVGSHFDTFYSNRYLTTLNLNTLYDQLDGIPCESIIILANTDNYGGGGIYNSYLLSAAHNKHSLPVVVHEFGHSFAGLADEYFYDDQYEPMYPSDVEPWEQNITTKKDFNSKWADMIGSNGVGIYEGAGYQSKGCYRPCQECRMKINEAPEFCPVCQRAITRLIRFLTE